MGPPTGREGVLSRGVNFAVRKSFGSFQIWMNRRMMAGFFVMLVVSQLSVGAMGKFAAEPNHGNGIDRMEGLRSWCRQHITSMRGMLQVEEQKTMKSDEQGTVKSDEQGTVKSGEQGTAKWDEQGTAKLDEQGPAKLDEQGAAKLDEQGPAKLDEQGPAKLDEQGPAKLDEHGAAKLNEQGTAESEKQENPGRENVMLNADLDAQKVVDGEPGSEPEKIDNLNNQTEGQELRAEKSEDGEAQAEAKSESKINIHKKGESEAENGEGGGDQSGKTVESEAENGEGGGDQSGKTVVKEQQQDEKPIEGQTPSQENIVEEAPAGESRVESEKQEKKEIEPTAGQKDSEVLSSELEKGNREQERNDVKAEPDVQSDEVDPAVREELKQGFSFHDPAYLLSPTIKDWDEQRQAWLDANPQFKSESHSKPRVLIVTGSTPKPCKTEGGDFFHIRAAKQKIDYARFHNYEIFYNFAHFDPLFDAYWVKIPTVRNLMLTHPEIEWFFWLDSDAFFTDMLFEPPWESYENYNMVMWGSEDGVFKWKSWVAYNAGVFLIRNCQWTLDLMDIWSPYGPSTIRYDVGKFLNTQLSKRYEGQPADDQSALTYVMIAHEDLKSKILLEDWKYQMSAYWLDVVDSYENLIENYHPGLGDMRWPWITHFTGCSPCSGDANPEFSFEKCMEGIDRAFHFADNQVLAYWGFQHDSLLSPNVSRIRNETDRPLERLELNPWAERIAEVAARKESSTSR